MTPETISTADCSASNEPPPAPAGGRAPLPGPPPLRAPPDFFSPLAAPAPAAVWPEAQGDQLTPRQGEGIRANDRLTLPDGHRAVRALWAAMRFQGVKVKELSDKAGVSVATLQNWHCGFYQPSIIALDRALAVVGLQLTVEPKSRND
jgi:hypothetical protein